MGRAGPRGGRVKLGGCARRSPSQALCWRVCLENPVTQGQQGPITCQRGQVGSSFPRAPEGLPRTSREVHCVSEHRNIYPWPSSRAHARSHHPHMPSAGPCPRRPLTTERLLWLCSRAPVGRNQKHSGWAAEGGGGAAPGGASPGPGLIGSGLGLRLCDDGMGHAREAQGKAPAWNQLVHPAATQALTP